MLVAKYAAYFNSIIYKGLHSLVSSPLINRPENQLCGISFYEHTGQLILDDFVSENQSKPFHESLANENQRS